MPVIKDTERYSLRGLALKTKIGYRILKAWADKGWLLPSCKLNTAVRYTMADFEKAERLSFNGEPKFEKSKVLNKNTGLLNFDRLFGG